MTDATPDTPAIRAIAATGISHEVTVHGRVGSLEEAAAARGVAPERLLKTLVVRRAEGDFLLVLVPGGRQIAWPKLRELLGVSRLSMPDADTAREVTGYERGTITPFGARPGGDGSPLPVVADASILADPSPVSIGGGTHGVGLTLDPSDLVAVTGAQVADVTDPE